MLLLIVPEPAYAGMQVSNLLKSYEVPGTTAKSLVRFMVLNPFQGDHGEAWASIHPNYSLSIPTKQQGAVCRAPDVNLRIEFVMTLPRAVDRVSMSARTRAAWDIFAEFARRHEKYHQAVYEAFARDFASKASRMTATSCFALKLEIQQQYEQMKRDCESRQQAFDRLQARILTNLMLFKLARA